tara:strand:+ start:344 stop:1171 length:828 start_codon:yes stop_codon:yes gene_type:complete
MDKNFTKDLEKFIERLRFRKHFAFARFSDGEARVLQDKKLVLTEDKITIGSHESGRGDKLSLNEQKEYNPKKHQWVREKLLDSLQFKKEGYYKGLSCKCCLSGAHGMTPEEEVKWFIELSGLNTYDEHLTWSNLWLNGNYGLFLEHMLPYFFNYDIILVANESADINGLPFKRNIIKDFRVGYNCMVNDYGLVDDIKKWIGDNKTEDSLFIFSAGSLSNFLAHQLYEFSDKNTYIDIGSSLNPFMGFPFDRRYLRQFWLNSQEPIMDIRKVCEWI